MTPEQLQAIRERCDEMPETWFFKSQATSLLNEIERLRGALARIERRSQAADRQFEKREGYPHRFDLSWWRGHADGLGKAAEIARQALEGSQ